MTQDERDALRDTFEQETTPGEDHLTTEKTDNQTDTKPTPPKEIYDTGDHQSHSEGRMPRISLLISIIAICGVLFILFTRNHQTTPAPLQPLGLTTADGASVSGTRVAFVRVDSVQNNYLMTIHFLDSIEQRFKSMERDLTSKQGALQQKVQNYYRDIQSGVLQEAMALRIKEQIEKEGDQLAALEEGYGNRITDLQLQLNIIYFDTLWNFLGRHKETFGVDMVVGYQQGMTNIFFADQALDLTVPVIELLNSEYAESHPGRKTKNKR